MIFFDGIYRLPEDRGKRARQQKKYASEWRVRIIDLAMSRPHVRHLRPYVVVASQDRESIFKSKCAESIGKRICRDFDLDVSQVLWIEHITTEPEQMKVAEFIQKIGFGYERYYTIRWREIRENELRTIQPFIPEAKDYKI